MEKQHTPFAKSFVSLQVWIERYTDINYMSMYQTHFKQGWHKYVGIEKYLGKLIDGQGKTKRIFVYDHEGLYDFIKSVNPSKIK